MGTFGNKQVTYAEICVSYFSDLILGSFGNEPLNKSRHYVLLILLCLFRDNYVNNW